MSHAHCSGNNLSPSIVRTSIAIALDISVCWAPRALYWTSVVHSTMHPNPAWDAIINDTGVGVIWTECAEGGLLVPFQQCE